MYIRAETVKYRDWCCKTFYCDTLMSLAMYTLHLSLFIDAVLLLLHYNGQSEHVTALYYRQRYRFLCLSEL